MSAHAAVSAATLEDALRASRLDHATLPPHPRKRHPCRLAENQLRLLHLVHLLETEHPAGCRFVRVITSTDLQGISPPLPRSRRRDAGAGAGNPDPPPRGVADWVLAVFVHECIVHKVLDYELTVAHVASPACMPVQVALEARHDLEQMRAAGLLRVFEMTGSRLAAATVSGSPWSSGTQRGGRVRVLTLTPAGRAKAGLLLRSGSRELKSVLTADAGQATTVPRRVVWHAPRREFLLCEAPDEMPADPATGLPMRPPRFRSPLPVPGSPLRSPVTKIQSSSSSSPTAADGLGRVEPLVVTRALRSTITQARRQVPSYVISPLLPACLVGYDLNNRTVKLRASNRAVAAQAVEMVLRRKAPRVAAAAVAAATTTKAGRQTSSSSSSPSSPSKALQFAQEEEALNEIASVTGQRGVEVFIAHWVAGLDASVVRDLNRRLTGGGGASVSHDAVRACAGSGVGSSDVFADTHTAARSWRSANECRHNAGEVNFSSQVQDMDRADAAAAGAMTAQQAASASSASPPGSPKAGRKFRSPPASPKGNDGAAQSPYVRMGFNNNNNNNQKDAAGTPRGRRCHTTHHRQVGSRVLEVLGAAGTSGRLDLRAVFTAEAIRDNSRAPLSGVRGRHHLGELLLSCEKDGSVTCCASIDAVDDRLVFAPSAASASRLVGMDGAGRGAVSGAAAGPGVSLDKLAKTVLGLQIECRDVLGCMLLDGHDPRSELSAHFGAVYGSRQAEPEGYVSLICGSIRPFMKPANYLDGSEYELRIAALIGECAGGAYEIGFGETLFVGTRGTLLVAKRPQRFHGTLVEHARLRSRDAVLDALDAQLRFLGGCISRMTAGGSGLEGDVHLVSAGSGGESRADGGAGVAASTPLDAGPGSDSPAALLLRLRRVIICVELLQASLRRTASNTRVATKGGHVGGHNGGGGLSACPVDEDGVDSDTDDDEMDHHPESTSKSCAAAAAAMENMEGRPIGRTTPFTRNGRYTSEGSSNNRISVSDEVGIRELKRLLEMRSLRASLTHRAKCVAARAERLRVLLCENTAAGGGGSSGGGAPLGTVGADVGGEIGGGGGLSSASSVMADQWAGSRAGAVSSDTVIVLLGALVAFGLFDRVAVSGVLPWGQDVEAWSWLGMNVGLWLVLSLVLLMIPRACAPVGRSCARCRKRACCDSSGGDGRAGRGPRVDVAVAPMLRVSTTLLERRLFCKCTVVDDNLEMSRFALGAGAADGAGAERRMRRGRRTITLSEPAAQLGWPSAAQWRGRRLRSRMEIAYDGARPDQATILAVRLEIDAAPPRWPFKWLHELLLSKWLQRLEDLEICSAEDHHVARQALRLNEAGFGSLS